MDANNLLKAIESAITWKEGFRIIWIVLPVLLLSFSFLVPKETYDPKPFDLEFPSYFGGRFKIPEDNPMTEEGVLLGRMLFYEPKLSANNQVSCGSCHQQQFAFTDGKALSEGVDGALTRRNSMSLANILWVRNLFWDGRIKGLEEQTAVPLTDPHEMGQSLEASSKKLQKVQHYPVLFKNAFGSAQITGENIVKAITQFERTLISSNSPYDKYLMGEYHPTLQELRGLNLFMTVPHPEKNIRGANCGQCHGTPKMFKELFHNNGLDSIPKDKGRADHTALQVDVGRFRVPTLRNIALTAPYMHDGRFATLEEVLDHYDDPFVNSPNFSSFIKMASNEVGGKRLMLTEDEKKDIVAFLHMLTDSTFITDPRFADPHPLYDFEN